MTATTSPTFVGPVNLSRRPSVQLTSRGQLARPILKGNSPISMGRLVNGASTSLSRKLSIGDSSDDDVPLPMKFSALTKALLNDEPSVVDASSPSGPRALSRDGAQSRTGFPNSHGDQNELSPKLSAQGRSGSPHPAPRVVRLSSGSPRSTTMRRNATSSSSQLTNEGKQSPSQDNEPQELITPAPRNIRIKGGVVYAGTSSGSSSSNKLNSSDRSLSTHEDNAYVIPATAQPQAVTSQASILPYGSSTTGRTRGGEEHGPAAQGSSLRVKRVGKVTGSFLSGPARRGRRRQSEEDGSPGQENIRPPVIDDGANGETQPASNAIPSDQLPTGTSCQYGSGQHPQENPQHRKSMSVDPIPQDEGVKPFASNSPQLQQPASQLTTSSVPKRFSNARSQPAFKVPAPPPSVPSAHDQENEPPPTFKRNKPFGFALLDQVEKAPDLLGGEMLRAASSTVSPERKALSTRSQNTPRRPAPPPPKMSVLETATATAGAATTSHSRKRRNHVAINGKTFTRMDCIGRGGSSRVYRVMAENYKIFALKKVTLEDVDEIAIKGYKGEIELLKRLDSVDRVVRLFDWEVNDEKQTLNVVSPTLTAICNQTN
jgi:serine/threonine-protein kinase TTK/MPS1